MIQFLARFLLFSFHQVTWSSGLITFVIIKRSGCEKWWWIRCCFVCLTLVLSHSFEIIGEGVIGFRYCRRFGHHLTWLRPSFKIQFNITLPKHWLCLALQAVDYTVLLTNELGRLCLKIMGTPFSNRCKRIFLLLAITLTVICIDYGLTSKLK